MDNEFNIDNATWGVQTDSVSDEQLKSKQNKVSGVPSKRRSTECLQLSEKFLMRRAYGEDILLQRMGIERLHNDTSYHFITGGDVDALSYLKAVLLHAKRIHYLLASTWCMSAEDIKQLIDWYEDGIIEKLDIYVGEIFPTTYVVEWRMLNNFYQEHPDAGRVKCFRNHSKIFAGFADKFDFAIETSANINTNPRTEQGVINISHDLALFYKNFFDKIE